MSKSKKNYPDPNIVLEKYGADAVRYYLMSNPVVNGENMNFSEAGVDEIAKKFITILRNVLAFYKLYAEHDDGRQPSGKHVLDAWILARLQETLRTETLALESYELAGAARVLQTFVTDLSTWYVRRSRDRMKVAGDDRAEALATLRYVLETFSKMLAPFMPFLAEMVYLEVGRQPSGVNRREQGDSVHLQLWPELDERRATNDVIAVMGEVRAIVSRIMDARDQAGKPVKQVLGQVTIFTPSGKFDEQYLQVVLDEVNIKSAEVKKGELAVEVDFKLTPELIREGMARELTRRVNGLRKEVGLTIADRIHLKVWSESEEVKQMIAEHGETLKQDTLSEALDFEPVEAKNKIQFRVAEQDLEVGF
jgi:isoleucyl-tRNA synthetase